MPPAAYCLETSRDGCVSSAEEGGFRVLLLELLVHALRRTQPLLSPLEPPLVGRALGQFLFSLDPSLFGRSQVCVRVPDLGADDSLLADRNPRRLRDSGQHDGPITRTIVLRKPRDLPYRARSQVHLPAFVLRPGVAPEHIVNVIQDHFDAGERVTREHGRGRITEIQNIVAKGEDEQATSRAPLRAPLRAL